MKNSNLLNRLLSYSHEKQSPQRFGRYAVMLIMLLTLGVGQVWAATATTVYYAVNTSYTVKCNVNRKGDGDDWKTYTMTKTAYKYNDKYIYSCSFTDLYDGLGKLQFQLYDGDTWKSQVEPISSWTGASTYNGKLYVSSWIDYRYDHTISNGATIVWDNAGNTGWANTYLYKEVNGGSGSNSSAFTRCGTSTQWYKTYASAETKIGKLQFRSNTSNWNDGTHTTDLINAGDLSGVTLFTYMNTKDGYALNWQVTTNAKKATSGTKIYFDNTDAWSGEIWLKYGTSTYNRSSAARAPQVTGTANLYVITIPNDCYFEKYYLASDYGWTGYNPINDTHVSKRIDYQASNLTSDITYVATGSTSGSSPTVYATTSFSGHTRRLTFGSHTNGQITVRYTDENGDEQTVSSASASYVDVAQTCNVVITAVPNTGYAPSGLTLGGDAITSGATQTIRADGTIAATFVAETTYNITVSYKYGSRTLHDAAVYSVGVTTPSNISSETIDGFEFSAWSDLTNVKNNTGDLVTDPININSTTAAGSMTCNYTPWTCSLDVVPSAGSTSYSSRTAMSYDATTKAYYKNFTTTAATQYFRFYINSIEYAPSSNTEMVIAGTRVAAATDVTDYGSNKPSVYFDDGGTGSNITVWFDYENKKAWVTEQKHTVTISAGANGSVSPTSVSVGNVVASGSITATPSDHYHLSGWTIPGGVTLVSGTTTTSPITIKATADDKEVSASFAGDVYTITYQDKGGSAFSGSQTTPPTSHTYGTATTLKIPTKSGYTFGGWFTDSDCEDEAVGTTSAASLGATDYTANITLYAKWTENMTTVNLVASPTGKGTFTSGGGAVTSVSAGVDTHPTVTAVPISGYRVNTSATVWSESSDYISLSSTTAAATTITGSGASGKSATLTATFTPRVYTITLNDNSGSGGVGSATVTFEDDDFAFASSFEAPTRTGYIFEGYFNASDMAYGEKLIDVDGTWLSDAYYYYIDKSGNWVYPNNYTLYAGWTPITYTVTYHANGGSAKDKQTDPTVTNWTYDVEQYISVPSSYFDAPTNYTLYSPYWNDSEHGVGTDYECEERSNLTSTDGDNIDLYAQWYLQITLDKNDEDATNNGSMRVRYNQPVTYNKAILPSRVGYHRTGFYTASEDGTKAFEADGTMVEGDVAGYIDDGYWIYTFDDPSDPAPTFYTYWAENHYDLSFNVNDCAAYVGEATGEKASLDDVAYETYVDITAGTMAREGYTFAGWSQTPGATSATYIGNPWRRISSTDGADITLYAVWAPISYTISFNALEGDCYTSSASIRMGDNYELPTAYGKSGYEFVGWYTRPTGGTLVTEETQMVTASDHTLYAHYEKKERVYFKNTLGWENVYVTWDAEWNRSSQDKGAGAYGKTQELMSHIYGTDIWYKDVPAAILSSWKGNIAFTNIAMPNYEWFDDGQAVYRRDFDSDATMFIPTPNDSCKYTKNTHDDKPGTVYYSTDMIVDKNDKEEITNYRYKSGYWVRYDELQSGYTVKGSWAWDDDHYVERHSLNDSTYEFTIRNLSANTDYWFNLYKHCTTSNNYSSVFKPQNDITSADADVIFSARYASGGDKKMHTTVAGDYTFKFVFSALGVIRLTIDYPVAVNDYRVVYGYTKGSAQTFASEYIKAKANAVDTISMFIHSADSATSRSLYIQKCTGIADGVPSWNTTYSAITLPSETASGKTSGVYNFRIAQNGSAAATGECLGKYEGNYYIRTDSAAGGWDFYKEYPASQMTYSEYSLSQTLSAPYSHYYCQYVGNTATDISYTVATDYSPAICPVMTGDATIGVGNKKLPSGKPASVRYTWNQETNGTFRSYLKSAQGAGNTRYLLIHGAEDDMIFNSAGAVIADSTAVNGLKKNELLFEDTENWVYELAIQAKPGAEVSIIAQYDGTDRYLVGGESSYETIIDGETASTKYDIAAVYDFKTNRLITTWIPSGTIAEEISEVDVLIERQYQDGGTTITFGKATEEAKAGSISAKRIIGALKFDYNDLVGRVASWNPTSRAKLMYFVSFPFDVNVSDIFGLNTEYGDAFVVQHYNSKLRAEKGFFGGDGTETFWEDMPVDTVMHANVGYVVVMDNDYMNGDVGHVWDNKKPGEHVYLYFPSANDPSDPIILNSDAKTVTLPEYKCNINRTFSGGKLNHKYTDSNWNVMGVPIFQNHTGSSAAGTPGAIFTPTSAPSDTSAYIDHPELGYFYKWATDKSYTVTSAVGFVFKPMHSYLVQFAGNVKFTQAAPEVVAAPRRTMLNEDYKIELQVLNTNEEMINRTYVELRENAVDTFALNEDLFMVTNKHAVNVYTFAGTYDVSANVLSIGSHTVQMGVIVKTAGTYTFTMPSNFSGTVTLIDTYAQTRTNLAISDYEVNLPQGTFDDRFELEINIHNAPTAIDGVEGGSLKDGKAHKFIMNDMLYILKDGVIYDARGNRVK